MAGTRTGKGKSASASQPAEPERDDDPTAEPVAEPAVEPDQDETPEPQAPPEVEPGQDDGDGSTPDPEPGQDEAPITQVPPETPRTLDAPVSDSAPLTAPVDKRPAKAPHPGDTAAAPNAVVRTAPGPHLRLVDDRGNEIDPDDVFLPQQGPLTMLIAAERVWQEYRYPGTDTAVKQLLINKGVPKPLRQAQQMINEIKAVVAENAAKAGPEQAAAS